MRSVIVAASAAIGLLSGLAAATIVTPVPATMVITLNLAYWLLWGVLALGVLWVCERWPLTGQRAVRAWFLHAVAGVAVGALHLYAFAFAGAVLRDWSEVTPPSAASVAATARARLEWEITMYWAVVALAHWQASRQENQRRALAEAQYRQELVEAKLVALQRQMHPHLLFNSLHAILALMHRDLDAAEHAVEALSDLLRALLAGDQRATTRLADELAIARQYVAIEQLNLGPRLRVQFSIDDHLLDAVVPRLLLQPLLENAIRHGVMGNPRGGTVTVRVEAAGDRLRIEVNDDGRGLGGASSGLGLAVANIERRLELLYGDTFTLALRNRDSGGACASIEIPLRHDMAGAYETRATDQRMPIGGPVPCA